EVPGAGEVLRTGMTGCSPSQREANPNASAFCATTAGSRGCRAENKEIPMFIVVSLWGTSERDKMTQPAQNRRVMLAWMRSYHVLHSRWTVAKVTPGLAGYIRHAMASSPEGLCTHFLQTRNCKVPAAMALTRGWYARRHRTSI